MPLSAFIILKFLFDVFGHREDWLVLNPLPSFIVHVHHEDRCYFNFPVFKWRGEGKPCRPRSDSSYRTIGAV